jgi:transposase
VAPRPGPCCAETARANRRLSDENQRLRDENARLTELLEQARRAGKRQAAPFSKGAPTAAPRRPGRRPGAAYGRATQRGVPEHIDEVVAVPLPPACPHCGAAVEPLGVAPQYHAELPPVRPHVTRFDIAIGRCRHCRRRVQGRHPRQTSDALGAAASQLGPRALALAADLNKALGLSFGKVSRLFHTFFGIAVSRAGLCRALERVARVAAPTYHALAGWIRHGAPVVTPDETGWKVGGRLQWLWVFVTEHVTLYTIQPGRGFAEAAQILGEDFAGMLVRDGWAPYRRFQDATHQTCLGHLLRRCRELLETAQAGAARFPSAVKALLQDALALRDRRARDELSPHGFAVARGRLEARADRLLAWQPTVEDNRKLAAHLGHERDALFTFLYHPELPATNWAAEQAIRPAVITRKVCGGNRTWRGAHTQEVLITVLRTAHQQARDPYALLGALLCAPVPRVAVELLPSARSP